MSTKEPRMNKVQLRAACREHGIKGYSKMTVQQMRDALRGKGDEDAAREFHQQDEAAAAKAEAVATPAKPADTVNGANGKGRPKAGGKCAAVWVWLDKNRNATLADVRAVAEKKGWNVSNASQELYAWRRFNGITGRVK